MKIYLMLVFVVVLVLLNVAISIFIARRDDLETVQKIFQIILIWLIPFLGAMGLWVLNRSHDFKPEAAKQPFGGGARDSIGGAGGDGD